jgi:hypothetical protein
MSQQKDLLREIAAATSSGAADRISDWFTEDFCRGSVLAALLGAAAARG